MVKVGLIAPFEELYREDGYAVLFAVQLAISQRNAQGGVADHQVVLVALNDNGRAEEAATQAAKLGIDSLVLGVIGPWQKSTATGASRELVAQNLPWIAPVALEPEQRWGGFSLTALPADVVRAAMARVRTGTAANTLVVYSDQASALEAAAKAGTSPDLSVILRPPLADGGSEGAHGYVWLGDAANGAKLVRQVADQTGEAPVMVGDPEVGSSVFGRRAGPAGYATRYLSSGLSSGPDGVLASFATAYEEHAGSAPGPQAVLAYDATNLLLDAIDRTGQTGGDLTREGVRQALITLGQEGWLGLSGTVVWREDSCPDSTGCWHWNNAPLREYPVDHQQD
jgi:branched-chain amino acid transport system substrate-binding protein